MPFQASSPPRAAAARDGAILRLALARRDYGRGVAQVEIAGLDYLPLWTENDTAELGPRSGSRPRPTIRVVAIGRALAAVRAELAGFPDPVPPGDAARWVRLRAREEHLLARKAAIAAVLGEDLESEPPPPEGPQAAAVPAPATAR